MFFVNVRIQKMDGDSTLTLLRLISNHNGSGEVDKLNTEMHILVHLRNTLTNYIFFSSTDISHFRQIFLNGLDLKVTSYKIKRRL